MIIRNLMVPVFAFAALATTTASAHGGWMHRACADDVQKFCSDIRPGDGRIIACLKSHEDQLSNTCQAAREKMRQHMEAFRAACGRDIVNLCSNVEMGHRRIMQCLISNQNQLSPGCNDLVTKARQRWQERMQQQQPPPPPAE